ncbi:MAG: VWA domain-containing protein [Actinobacteria bacterium]|nr:VWA domain-containing protein [Actinomycetota bacterium]
MNQVGPGPVRDIATFADALRSRGMTVTPDQMTDMTRSLGLVDPARRSQVHAALRSLAVTDPSQREIFDEEFDHFFSRSHRSRSTEPKGSSLLAASAVSHVKQRVGDEGTDDAVTHDGASAVENVSGRDIADLDDDQLAEARRLVSAMFWRPTDFRTRRWVLDDAGRRPDMRRTLHAGVGPEGDLMRLEMRRRRTRQRPLIIIADISGSMERYADLFLFFAHAAQHRLEHVEVFTFSTRLTRITDDLAKRDARTALASAGRTVTDWSGGTMIGEAFAAWNRMWSRRMARGRPVAMILSDGWDCGDPGLLAVETARLARSVGSLIWLNPLAGRADYTPATRGMRTVLPHVDHLLPAASIDDLRDLVRLLDTMAR